jgi:hypothetical protein
VQVEEGPVLAAADDAVTAAALRDDGVYEIGGAAGQDTDSQPRILLGDLRQDVCHELVTSQNQQPTCGNFEGHERRESALAVCKARPSEALARAGSTKGVVGKRVTEQEHSIATLTRAREQEY